jgi:hypothetical protein
MLDAVVENRESGLDLRDWKTRIDYFCRGHETFNVPGGIESTREAQLRELITSGTDIYSAAESCGATDKKAFEMLNELLRKEKIDPDIIDAFY